MKPSSRPAVSTFLETFVLLGVAVGGSALVLSATSGYAAAAQGASISVTDLSIVQGSGEAIERIVISNTGTVLFNSFTISTQGIAPNQFYVSITDAATRSPIAPSPSSGTAPALVVESVSLKPGQSLIVSFAIQGNPEFSIGSTYNIVVSSPAGAQSAAETVAIPA